MHPPTLKLGSFIYLPSPFFKINKKTVYKHFAKRKAKKSINLSEGENNY